MSARTTTSGAGIAPFAARRNTRPALRELALDPCIDASSPRGETVMKGSISKKLVLATILAIFGILTPGAAWDPDCNCLYIPCNLPPECSQYGYCMCYIEWDVFPNNYPCIECGRGRAYYIVGTEYSPPCQYFCGAPPVETVVQACMNCVIG
jgi:hypothetical protein